MDDRTGKARPIGDLIAEFESGERSAPSGLSWGQLPELERRAVIDGYRLAYISEELVNWCPGLGTVLANEEVTPDGRSDIGNYPVYRRPLRQWMLRITAFAERLIADLDELQWPESIKQLQRNWIGASDGELDPETLRRLHQTIMVVREDLETLRYNTAIARLIELTTHAAQVAAARGALPRALAEPLALMVAPLAPHIAEELWARLGHPGSLAYAPFPVADPALAAEPTVELPVQVNGKVRFTIEVPADAGEDEIRHVLTGHGDLGRHTGGAAVIVIVPGRIANVVVAPPA